MYPGPRIPLVPSTSARTTLPFAHRDLKVWAFVALIPFLFFSLVMHSPAPISFAILGLRLLAAAGGVAATITIWEFAKGQLAKAKADLQKVDDKIRDKRLEHNSLTKA